MVIIDTSIWVTAYKVKTSKEKSEIARLVIANEAAIVGMVFAEVLRGARSDQEFEELTEELLGTEFLETAFEDWERAARILLDLQRSGEVIPLQDALIAAHALNGNHSVYSTDNHFKRVTGLQIHESP